MANQVIDELTQLAPRIKAVLETERRTEQGRQERREKAEAVLSALRTGLETIAGEVAATMGVQPSVNNDPTVADRIPRGDSPLGSADLEWTDGFRLTLALQQPVPCALECVAMARLYTDGQLQLLAVHFVNQQAVWSGERRLAVGSEEQETAAAELLEELNDYLPAAVRQFSELLPA